MSDNKESILKPVIVGSLILGAAIYYAPIALYDHKISYCVDVYLTDSYTGKRPAKPSKSQLAVANSQCVHSSIK